MLKRKMINSVALVIALAGASWTYAQSGKAMKLTADDYSEIKELYANYAQALDLGKPEDFPELFTPDGGVVSSRPPGRATEVQTPTKGHDVLFNHGNTGTRHLTSNLVITPTADGVKATTYLILINTRTSPAVLTYTGLFEADVVKTAAGWKFKKLVVWRDDDDITPFKPTKPLAPAQGKKK